VEEFARFLPATSGQPALLWVTPMMQLIGHTLAKNGQEPVSEVVSVEPIRGLPTASLGSKERPVVVSAKPKWFVEPAGCDEETGLHVTLRKRYLVDSNGRRQRQFATEQLLFRANADVHRNDLAGGLMPAVRPHHHKAPQAADFAGWIDTPHITLIRLDAIKKDCHDFAWADYIAYRFATGEPWKLSEIVGTEGFDSFVQHHPELERLLAALHE
jgi:hypothetical protein